jgi:hypothetical protein
MLSITIGGPCGTGVALGDVGLDDAKDGDGDVVTDEEEPGDEGDDAVGTCDVPKDETG